jgi:hypothetical protein
MRCQDVARFQLLLLVPEATGSLLGLERGGRDGRGALRLSRILFAASGTCGFVLLFGKRLQIL